MTTRKAIFDAIRDSRGRGWPANDPEIRTIDAFLDGIGVPRPGADVRDAPATLDPPWVTVGRTLIGQREIPGPRHNSWIASGWARLGAKWFNDDETPWCGFFVAHCLDAAGMPYPAGGTFARALAWKDYGRGLTSPAVGAIGVKGRAGGGHVFFIVGETADKRYFKVLEGNANNMVRIGDVAKADVLAIRWPPAAAVPLPKDRRLPVMTRGAIAESEA